MKFNILMKKTGLIILFLGILHLTNGQNPNPDCIPSNKNFEVGEKIKYVLIYDWFYQVRDIYETWVDPETLKPYYYKRDVNEGGYEIDITYQYNWEDSVAYAQSKKTRKPFKRDTVTLNGCSQDIMSIIYYARSIDFSKYEVGEKIPLSLLLDSKMEPVYIRYQGKEEKRVRGLGKFNCIKFSAYLVPGSVFKGGED